MTIKVFAPATVANVGPGFDIFGFAIEGLGDTVEAVKIDEPKVIITEISGDNGQLSKNAEENTAGIAAAETLKILKEKHKIATGVQLKLNKNMPLESGLGSSSASAAAAAYATNLSYGNKLKKKELVQPCVYAEQAVSGTHADNVAASLFGGFIFIKNYDPFEVISLKVPDDFFAVVATPNFNLSTAKSRSALPEKISLKAHIKNNASSCSVILGILLKNAEFFGRSIQDTIIEPVRAKLIPGFLEVKKAAINTGAFGCSISSAGPSVFAITNSQEKGEEIGNAMKAGFQSAGLDSTFIVSKINPDGAKEI